MSFDFGLKFSALRAFDCLQFIIMSQRLMYCIYCTNILVNIYIWSVYLIFVTQFKPVSQSIQIQTRLSLSYTMMTEPGALELACVKRRKCYLFLSPSWLLFSF